MSLRSPRANDFYATEPEPGRFRHEGAGMVNRSRPSVFSQTGLAADRKPFLPAAADPKERARRWVANSVFANATG